MLPTKSNGAAITGLGQQAHCLSEVFQRVEAVLTGGGNALTADKTALHNLEEGLSQLTGLADADDLTSSAGRYYFMSFMQYDGLCFDVIFC